MSTTRFPRAASLLSAFAVVMTLNLPLVACTGDTSDGMKSVDGNGATGGQAGTGGSQAVEPDPNDHSLMDSCTGTFVCPTGLLDRAIEYALYKENGYCSVEYIYELHADGSVKFDDLPHHDVVWSGNANTLKLVSTNPQVPDTVVTTLCQRPGKVKYSRVDQGGVDACHGEPSPCAGRSGATCTEQPGCALNAGACTGEPDSCDTYRDLEHACTTVGCRWGR